VRSSPVRHISATRASNHAMSASVMIDKSTVVGAGDDDRVDPTFADGAHVAVISECAVCLADVARPAATVSAVGEALSSYLLRRKRLRAWWSGGVSRNDADMNECRLPRCSASSCHHDLQDVGCAQKRSATRRASSDTIEQSPQRRGLHLCRRALRGVLQRVPMIGAHKSASIAVRVTVESLTVPDHVKLHIGHRRQSTPESVVEKPQLALRCEVAVTDHGAKSGRATHSGVLFDIRSGAGDPVLTSERMSWFPSRTWRMAVGSLLLIVLSSIRSSRCSTARPSACRCVHHWPKAAVHQVSAGRGEWSSPIPPVHPGDYCEILRLRDDVVSGCR
jgi:hypothetical protein